MSRDERPVTCGDRWPLGLLRCEAVRNVRQHVNPLASEYMRPRAQRLARPDSLASDAPLEVELGCADGDFCFAWAEREPSTWVVGLEIREAWVEKNARKAERLGRSNLSFAYVNLNVDLDRVFDEGQVDRFHLLFPDPWFKARHRKRRVVEAGFLDTVGRLLREGGELHVATDVWDLGLDAMAHLEDLGRPRGFTNLAGPWSFWRGNPFGVESRRERTTRDRDQRVWRMRYAWSGINVATSGKKSVSSNSVQPA